MNSEDENQILLVNNTSKLTANICFINSSIQLLKKTGFVKYILLNRSKLEEDMTVCNALVNLFTLGSSPEKSAGLIRVLVAEKSKKAYFNNQTQQDAEEFLRSLIDVISLELKDDVEFISVKNQHWGEERIRKVFLDNLPVGSSLQCNQFPSSRDEEFLFLKLIIPRLSTSINLTTLIKSHYSSSSTCLWMKCSNWCPHEKCPQTGFCNRKAISKTQLRTVPEYLLISLLRFGESMLENKVNTLVELEEKVVLPEGSVYKLVSTICHVGPSLNSGHYVNYCRRSTGHWWLQDDNLASKTSFEQVVKSSTYIILLEKKTKITWMLRTHFFWSSQLIHKI